MLSAFVTGAVLAFGLILPLGAQNLFIFSQGARHARLRHALPAVLTAALSDTALILAATSGVSLLLAAVPSWQSAIGYAGVIFLVYMGWSTWPKRRLSPVGQDGASAAVEAAFTNQATVDRTSWPARRQIMFALSVSLLNPHALLDTVGVIGVTALQFQAPGDRLQFTVACIGVSWLWFLGLAATGHLLRRSDSTGRTTAWLGRASAVLMWLIAARLLASLLANSP